MNSRCLSLRRSLGDCGNPREQSISWIPRRFAPSNEHAFVITSLAPPGVVIQLDGHGAERLALTFSEFIATITQARACSKLSRWQSGKWFIALITEGLGVRSSSRNDKPQNRVSAAHDPSVKLSLQIVHVRDDSDYQRLIFR
jgi:hypothetical protein